MYNHDWWALSGTPPLTGNANALQCHTIPEPVQHWDLDLDRMEWSGVLVTRVPSFQLPSMELVTLFSKIPEETNCKDDYVNAHFFRYFLLLVLYHSFSWVSWRTFLQGFIHILLSNISFVFPVMLFTFFCPSDVQGRVIWSFHRDWLTFYNPCSK